MKSKKPVLALMVAIALIISMFAAIPAFAVFIRLEPFIAVEEPVGAYYLYGDIADDLKAEFLYDAAVRSDEFGVVDDDTITVSWYWSEDGSTIDRTNLWSTDPDAAFDYDLIDINTSVEPDTLIVGTRYYFAVISFLGNDGANSERMECIAGPAKVTVDAWFEAEKTDVDGEPLAGAVLALDPDTNPRHFGNGSEQSYEGTTGVDGRTTFIVPPGAYILTEKKAPDGYTLSGQMFYVWVTENGVMDVQSYEDQEMLPYEMDTFVNEKERQPNPGPSYRPQPDPEFDIEVLKTDGDGNPLSGAVIMLTTDISDDANRTEKTYEATTENGKAKFTVPAGSYILSEKTAPEGYNATDDKYNVVVTANGIYLASEDVLLPYEPVTFVNKAIPTLEKSSHFAYMQGYEDYTFRPGRDMSRAEAVIMFSRLLSESMDLAVDYRIDCFSDINIANDSMLQPWYVNQVCYMYTLGVLADFSQNGLFRPDEAVTRAEFAVLAAHFDKLELDAESKFADVGEEHWAAKYINSAAAKGWVEGYGDGTFLPEASITRAEVVTLVNRMLGRVADAEYLNANANSLPKSYTDMNASHWAYLAVMEASIGHAYEKSGTVETWGSENS